MKRPTSRVLALVLCVWVAAWAAPVWSQDKAAEPSASPSPECLKVLDTLASSIPKEESLAELKRKGVRLTVPLLPSGVDSTTESRGVVVRMQIDVDGRPVPGSGRVVKTLGGDGLSQAVEAAVADMGFDLTGASRLNFPFTFSTAYVSCARQ